MDHSHRLKRCRQVKSWIRQLPNDRIVFQLDGCQPKNRGDFTPPKWMVYFMENPIKIHDLGGFPIFLETPIFFQGRKCETSGGV